MCPVPVTSTRTAFYYRSPDSDQVHGPFTETEVHDWYNQSYFSSEVKFQICRPLQEDPAREWVTLGDLIRENGHRVPFFFCAEAANSENRQIREFYRLSDRVTKLEQAMEHSKYENINTFRKENQSTKDELVALKAQVASLLIAQTEMSTKINEVSSKSDIPCPKLDKKIDEMKKKVADQDKMRKELSTVSSKCDKSVTELEKVQTKQKKLEDSLSGFDRRITKIKDFEKTLHDNVTSCEQNVTSTREQLVLMKCEIDLLIGKVQEDMCKEKAEMLQRLIDQNESMYGELKKNCDKLRRYVDNNIIKTTKEFENFEKKLSSTQTSVQQLRDEFDQWNKDESSSEDEDEEENENKEEEEGEDKDAERGTKPEEPQKQHQPFTTMALVQGILDNPIKASPENDSNINVFLELFRKYLLALRERTLDSFKFTMKGIGPMLDGLVKSPDFMDLAKGVLFELFEAPSCCEDHELMCWDCNVRMMTPLHMLEHLADSDHGKLSYAHGPHNSLMITVVKKVASKVMNLLQMDSNDEQELFETGRKRYIAVKDDPHLRPEDQFLSEKEQLYINLGYSGDERALTLSQTCDKLTQENVDYLMKMYRKWLREETNRRRLLAEFEEHVNKDESMILYCSACQVAYISTEEYFQHIDSYRHAQMDKTLLTGIFLRAARNTFCVKSSRD